jgi:hypothetical protein
MPFDTEIVEHRDVLGRLFAQVKLRELCCDPREIQASEAPPEEIV